MKKIIISIIIYGHEDYLLVIFILIIVKAVVRACNAYRF